MSSRNQNYGRFGAWAKKTGGGRICRRTILGKSGWSSDDCKKVIASPKKLAFMLRAQGKRIQ